MTRTNREMVPKKNSHFRKGFLQANSLILVYMVTRSADSIRLSCRRGSKDCSKSRGHKQRMRKPSFTWTNRNRKNEGKHLLSKEERLTTRELCMLYVVLTLCAIKKFNSSCVGFDR